MALLGVALLCGSAAAGSFGLGIIAGEPTGISGELWLTRSTALTAAVAWSFEGGDDAVLVQADYVFYNMGLFDVKRGAMGLYFGLGGRVRFGDDEQVGIRVPIGIDYMFGNAPIDVFGEVVPIVDLVDESELNFGAGVGVRYFFGGTAH